MVSTYFRLGDFLEAEEAAEDLVFLRESLEDASLLVDSLYKLSAAVRGKGGEKEELFAKARSLASKALSVYEESGLDDPVLKAKVLFNMGAAECDDLKGDYKKGAKIYKEALSLLEKLEKENLEERTKMHMRYLKAQVLFTRGSYKLAKEEAEGGLLTAVRLQVKADIKRFEKLLVDIL